MAAASPEEVKRVANLAYATEFVEQLPEGFDTLVGEDALACQVASVSA